jgi:hypothetical protein
MSMVIMHMAMVIAIVVGANILTFDTGGEGRLSNWIRRNVVKKKRNYCGNRTKCEMERSW